MTTTTRAAHGMRTLLCTLFLSVLLSPALADDFSITSGLSAHWFNPERSGEGLVLEILSEESALLYWFTYDEEGNQRWLIDVGEIDGAGIVFPELTVTRGGRFGPDFDPDEVEYEVVGQAVLQFSDCDHSEFSYTAFGHSETIPMQRLSQTMAAGCQPINGVPGQPIREYAGQSGSWYDPSHTGEGYTLQWMSRDEAVLIWFSYDPEGNQYWMIGMGERQDGDFVFQNLQSTRGGRFGPDFSPAEIEFIDWGELVLEIDCNGGTARYDSEIEEFGGGELNIERLTRLKQPDCPWEAPEFTNLYDVVFTQVSITINGSSENIRAQKITDDGTIIGRLGTAEGTWAITKAPGDEDWHILDGEIAISGVAASDNGEIIIANEPSTETLEEPRRPLVRKKGSSWMPLNDLIFQRSGFRGASRNGLFVVGTGRVSLSALLKPWIWEESEGQLELAGFSSEQDLMTPTPRAVSNDGRIIAGVGHRTATDGFVPVRDVAVLWVDGGSPKILYDSFGAELGFLNACNADCSVVAGAGQAVFDSDHPHHRQGWYWTKMGDSGYIDIPEDAVLNATVHPLLPKDISGDGTMLVGTYPVFTPDGFPGTRAFIWTQATGLVTVPRLMQSIGLDNADSWRQMHAVSATSDGSRILLTGTGRFGNVSRIATIQLLRKQGDL